MIVSSALVWKARLAGLAASLLVLCTLAADAMAAGGGKPATKLVNVADTRAMGPGFSRWVADLYNDSYWLFALAVVVIMALQGLILGWVFDRLVGMLGINLGKLDHHE
jgi:hypothetical protein